MALFAVSILKLFLKKRSYFTRLAEFLKDSCQGILDLQINLIYCVCSSWHDTAYLRVKKQKPETCPSFLPKMTGFIIGLYQRSPFTLHICGADRTCDLGKVVEICL